MTASVESRARVLVVDDNAQNRLVAEGHLMSFGYDVTLASGGREALERFAEGAIDLVLLDIDMPGMNGFETCERLRELAKGESTPIVFLTALDDLATHARAMATGADDFLSKPIQRVELQIRVRSLLRLKRLRDALTESTELVRQQRDALLASQERKRAMTAFIVHDLKNPLTGVLANTQWLLAHAKLDVEHREAMDDVAAASETMHRMVMDLLDVDRAESKKLSLRLSEVVVADLLRECVRSVRARANDRQHTFAVTVPAGLPKLYVDRELIHRAVANLLDNALKFAPRSTEISIEAQPGDGATVRLLVRDEGPGVPQDKRSQVFDTYARLDRDADVHASSSRGLGLAFCRIAIEAHGGRIWIEDAQPRGSLFCVELPCAEPAEIARADGA